MNKLYMMCGIPGSGKSTFAKEMMAEGDVYVSRDDIRFSLVAPDADYFSQEKKVFTEFVYRIVMALKEDKNVWADATHISVPSRAKLLNAITEQVEIDNLIVYYVGTPLDVAIERNEKRKGTRSYVPPEAIIKMHEKFAPPEIGEIKAHEYDDIIFVGLNWRGEEE